MACLLFIGDIVGRPGRDLVASKVAALRQQYGIDFVVANGENVAAGAGITAGLARTLLEAGLDGLTLGDHVWDQKGWEGEIGAFPKVCRPANLPSRCPGRDHLVLESGGLRLAVFTVLGRSFVGMKGECPFACADALLARTVGAGLADLAFVEVHAEATSEKQSLGRYLDGRAIAVLGTHTHVATADATVLPKGTAFQCDVGMTGPYASILGREIAPCIARFLDGMPRRCEVAEGDPELHATLVTFDPASKRATACTPLVIRP